MSLQYNSPVKGFVEPQSGPLAKSRKIAVRRDPWLPAGRHAPTPNRRSRNAVYLPTTSGRGCLLTNFLVVAPQEE